jgi:hypothetical protein
LPTGLPSRQEFLSAVLQQIHFSTCRSFLRIHFTLA